MQPDYEPIQLATDATRFARSKFGVHYLGRLERRQAQLVATALKASTPNTDKLKALAQHAALSDEIEFFRVSQQIKSDPSLLQRLRDGAAKRLKREEARAEQ